MSIDFHRFSTISHGLQVVSIHPSVLIAQRSRFLCDLFGPELPKSEAPVPVRPPHPELLLRALHSITTRARPEVTESEFVGFVRLSAFLQSDELDARLCEAGLAAWKSLTKQPEFRNPCGAQGFGEGFVVCWLQNRRTCILVCSIEFDIGCVWLNYLRFLAQLSDTFVPEHCAAQAPAENTKCIRTTF